MNLARNASTDLIRIRCDTDTGAVAALRLSEHPGAVSAQLRAARRRTLACLWPGAPTAPMALSIQGEAVAGADAAAACDRALLTHGGAPDRLWLDFEEAELAALPKGQAAAGLERLKRRGWRLALRLAPGAPLPLDRAARSLFAEYVAPAEALGRTMEPDHPLWIRLLAARAGGALCTLANAENRFESQFAFDLIEQPLPVHWSAQAPAARPSTRSAASSLSIR